MSLSTNCAIALLRLQVRYPHLRISLALRDDKPPVTANQTIAYIQMRYEHEKPSVDWWTFAAQVLDASR